MTLHDLLNSDVYQRWESDRLGNDLFLNDPERAARIHSYAEEGQNGSTHEEIILDWRDYLVCAPQKRKPRLQYWVGHLLNG